MDNVLKVRNLRVWFPVRKGVFSRVVANVKAVDDVSFDLHQGETLGIVGESGSGKTTLVRVIAGLQKPTQGTVTVRGRVAMVFQDPLGSLNPRMTVRSVLDEAIRHAATVRSSDGGRSTAASLLNLVGLETSALDKYPHEFSGGQRQRISIARAIATNPAVLICDEAVSALDLSIRAQILDLLDDLKRRFDLSMLFITHDLGVVRNIAGRVLVMHGGRIVEEGPCGQVLRAPREDYTRYLMASVPKIGKPLT